MNNKTIHNSAYRSLIGKMRLGRLHAGLTQKEAAKKIGKSRAWIQKIESCEVRLCPRGLIRLSQAYRIDAAQLIKELEIENSTGKYSKISLVTIH